MPVPGVLCAKKSDLAYQRKVTHAEAVAWATPLQIPVIETSAKTGQNVPEASITLVQLIGRPESASKGDHTSVPLVHPATTAAPLLLHSDILSAGLRRLCNLLSRCRPAPASLTWPRGVLYVGIRVASPIMLASAMLHSTSE